jgi:hypothetical protein
MREGDLVFGEAWGCGLIVDVIEGHTHIATSLNKTFEFPRMYRLLAGGKFIMIVKSDVMDGTVVSYHGYRTA